VEVQPQKPSLDTMDTQAAKEFSFRTQDELLGVGSSRSSSVVVVATPNTGERCKWLRSRLH